MQILFRRGTQHRKHQSIFLHSLIFIDPIYLPGLAPIIGEGLFGSCGIRRSRPNSESDKYGSPVVWFLIVKFNLTILEFANHGLACRGVQDAYSTCSEVVYRLVSFHLQSSREEGMAYTTFIDQFTPKCGNKSVRGIPME
jgi:hypothetical protein